MSFKKFKMAAGRHFEKGAVAQIPQRYKNSIRSYFVQDHLNYQKMQKPRLPPSGVPSLCWHPDYVLEQALTSVKSSISPTYIHNRVQNTVYSVKYMMNGQSEIIYLFLYGRK